MENRRNFVTYLCGLFAAPFVVTHNYHDSNNLQKFKLGDKVRVKSLPNIVGDVVSARLRRDDVYIFTLQAMKTITSKKEDSSNIRYSIRLDGESKRIMEEQKPFAAKMFKNLGFFDEYTVNQDNLEKTS